MKDGAPTHISIISTGTTNITQCDIAIHGTCIADPNGPVKQYLVGPKQDPINCCQPCYEQMILAGQWVSP
jgi:hypothetical protein